MNAPLPFASDVPRDAVERRLVLADRTIRLWTPPSSEALLEDLAARDASDPDLRDERLPYWADIWPSSRALAERILRAPPFAPGDRVVELGCGLGLAGIAAGLVGARVCMTDYAPDALAYAAANWRRNVGTDPETRLLDWRTPDPGLRARVLIAADVAYEQRFFEPLLRTFTTCLEPGGPILLAEPRRTLAEPFFDMLREARFQGRAETVEIGHTAVDVHVLCGPS